MTDANRPTDAVVCVTTDRSPVKWETTRKEWTIAELRETFPEGDGSIVDGLLTYIARLHEREAGVAFIMDESFGDPRTTVALGPDGVKVNAPEPAAPTTNSVSVSSKSASPGEPSVEQRKPDGYAFRYPDGFIRFSGGTRYNGDEPTETIPYYFGSPAPEPAGKCGTCGESIKPDRLTGTTCACVTRMRDCICSDPENCREPVPGRRCKAGLSVNGALKHE